MEKRHEKTYRVYEFNLNKNVYNIQAVIPSTISLVFKWHVYSLYITGVINNIELILNYILDSI